MSEQIYNYEDLLAFCRRKPAEFDAYIRDLTRVKGEELLQVEIEEKVRRREAEAKAKDEGVVHPVHAVAEPVIVPAEHAPEEPVPIEEPKATEPEPAPVIVEKTEPAPVEVPKPKKKTPVKPEKEALDASPPTNPDSAASPDAASTD